jgi:hypothetical protein
VADFLLLFAESMGGRIDGTNNILIPGAPAKISCNGFDNFRSIGIRIFCQQSVGAH